MWDGTDGVLYAQVGLGSGNARLRGDHDAWRLSEEDDDLSVRPGDPDYLVKYRPMFRATAPGEPVRPNLTGRVAAAFAPAAQTHAEQDPQAARRWLDKAADVYARADTGRRGLLVTTVPTSHYREVSWSDDMEWAAWNWRGRRKSWATSRARGGTGGGRRGALAHLVRGARHSGRLGRRRPRPRGSAVLARPGRRHQDRT
ncbi:glycoside hydrolase family 9 protein [Streptomyces sp. NPDC050564]|uniref:glycoside hydrolase family 9 protein n=1 Tax=Streptomyces sp. NPDC050564 TaxID=3365631 RepID=UPI0037927860